MEEKPLLEERTSYDSTADCNKRPSLKPSFSYDQLPPSIAGYFGDNYHCIITRNPHDKQHTDRPASGSESSGNSHVDSRTPKKHRPIFICLVTLVHLVMTAYSCIVGGIESIGLVSYYEHQTAPKFGSIHKAKENQTQENFGIYPGKNIFIGPNVSFLVRLGALYPPVSIVISIMLLSLIVRIIVSDLDNNCQGGSSDCILSIVCWWEVKILISLQCMRADNKISKRIISQKKTEKTFICCSLNNECTMMADKRCVSLSGEVIGNSTTCSSSSLKCINGVTLRPCCIGVHAKCLIVSQKKCHILKGQWHSNKLLCSDVNCLDGICGLTGTYQTYGHQFYRVFTPIFLHIGILHLVTNLLFQIIVGCKIEIEIGTMWTAMIYIASGLGGNLFSGIFTPLIPQVGASGALFGLMGLILVYYIQNYNRLRRPFVDLCAIIAVILFSFALGTIPYIGNFVHLGGFIFGILVTIIVSKSAGASQAEVSGHRHVRQVVCFILLVLITAISFTIFFTYENDFCPQCKYVDCIPYTSTFCPDMSSDGILNADYQNT